jgi:ATP-binding cassette subfamily B protein
MKKAMTQVESLSLAFTYHGNNLAATADPALSVLDGGDAEIKFLGHQIGDGEWLETLPQGLNTQVGERGGRLSMGQRQLVSLMRVLVHNPSIFILDEATASIDPFTEWQIQQALDMILKKSTSILIAHRLSTVKAADRIIVVKSGQIIEEGDHDNLLALKGHYADLYNTYFRHQSLAYIEQSREFVSSD